MAIAEKIYEEAKRLPDSVAREVLDFMGYLEQKYGSDWATDRDLIQAQNAAMAHAWGQVEDTVWDDV